MLLSFILIFSFLPYTVKSSTLRVYGFEASVINQQVSIGESNFFQTQADGIARVRNDNPLNGIKCYRMQDASKSYWNYSNLIIGESVNQYIINWSIWIDGSYAGNFNYYDFRFYDSSDNNLIWLRYEICVGGGTYNFWYHDGGGWNMLCNNAMTYDKIGFQYINNQTVNYYCYDLTGDSWNVAQDIPYILVDNPYIIRCYISESQAGTGFIDLDDHSIIHGSIGEDEGEEGYAIESYINLRFFDMQTGNQLYYVTSKFIGALNNPIDVSRGFIYSDLYSGAYGDSNLFGDIIEIDYSVIDGTFHYIKISGYGDTSFQGYVNGELVAFLPFNQTFRMYSFQTYDIWLRQVGYYGDEYENEDSDFTCFEHVYLSTDKLQYILGEQIKVRYKLPTINDLYGCVGTFGWEILFDKNGLNVFEYLWSNFDDITQQYTIGNLVYGQYDYKYIDSNDLPYPDGGLTKYFLYICRYGGSIFPNQYLYDDGLFIMLYNGSFVPTGTIISVSPNNPYIGQNVLISWSANNNGVLKYKNIFNPNIPETTITTFEKTGGTLFTNISFMEFGAYKLNLYVNDGFNMTLQDSEPLWVNSTDLNYSGYNVEYCEVLNDKLIAGFDYCRIMYNCFNDSTYIFITNPRGATTRYSTMLNSGNGIYSFKIDANSPIGLYNVSMHGLNGTLYDYFNVVATENNWIEFSKNTYYDDENFVLYQRHDKNIAITFYKKIGNQYIAQGENIFFTSTQNIYGDMIIPNSIVSLSSGTWRVEMWEVNNRARIRELAEWEATVYVKSYVLVPEIPDWGDMVNNMDDLTKGLLGLIVCFVVTITPIMVVMGAEKINFKIDIPPIIYAVFMGGGSVLAYAFGFWAFEVLFFMCIMAGFGIFAMWLKNYISKEST